MTKIKKPTDDKHIEYNTFQFLEATNQQFTKQELIEIRDNLRDWTEIARDLIDDFDDGDNEDDSGS